LKDRKLTEDTKNYNLYQKYLKYKKLTSDGRINKFILFQYPEFINVDDIEEKLKNLVRTHTNIKKRKLSENTKKKVRSIQNIKNLYREFYTKDKVNEGQMSNNLFENIINNGNDKILDFSIDFNFTKEQFMLENNPVIFEIQDGMYEYLSKDDNIKKLYSWIDEVIEYNQAKEFIKNNVSSSYSTQQKLHKLASMENDLEYSFSDRCIEIIKDRYYNSPLLFKADLLLNKNILNIDNLELAKKITKYSNISKLSISEA